MNDDSKIGSAQDGEVERAYSQHEHASDLDEKAKISDFKADAMEAEHAEHSMGVLEAVGAYPMASFWAFVMSCTIVSYPSPLSIETCKRTSADIIDLQIMESYDVFLMGNFVALPRFKQDFGILHNGEWVIETKWQSALQVSGQVSTPSYSSVVSSFRGGDQDLRRISFAPWK